MTSEGGEGLDVKPLHLLGHGVEKKHSVLARTSTLAMYWDVQAQNIYTPDSEWDE
jgi:hypothetical protein